MNAGAGFSGVQTEAGLGVGVVGDLGAAGCVEGDIGLAGGDDLYAARGEQRTQADAEGEGEGFFRLAGEMAAVVVSAVSSVKHDEKAGRRGSGHWRGGCGLRRGNLRDGRLGRRLRAGDGCCADGESRGEWPVKNTGER